MSQGSLFGISVPPEVHLTERQWFALEVIAATRPSSSVLGHELHKRRGCSYCRPTKPCQFAQSEGAQMGARLRDDGLVRFSRKRDEWFLVVPGEKVDDGEIPF